MHTLQRRRPSFELIGPAGGVTWIGDRDALTQFTHLAHAAVGEHNSNRPCEGFRDPPHSLAQCILVVRLADRVSLRTRARRPGIVVDRVRQWAARIGFSVIAPPCWNGRRKFRSDGRDDATGRDSSRSRFDHTGDCCGLDWGSPAPRLGKRDKPFQRSGRYAPAFQKSPIRRCFKPRPPPSARFAGFASGCRSDFLERVLDLSPGGWRASCPATYRPTHVHRHVRIWARCK